MEKKHQTINVKNITLWDENPRGADIHAKKGLSESQIIETFFRTKKKTSEMFELAKDIIENGLIETQLICVLHEKEKDKLISIDGNRRVITLKLINNPSLVDKKTHKKVFDFYDKIKKDDVDEDVFCFVTTDIKRALLIAEKNHLGPNKGRGLVEWDSEEKTFFYNEHRKEVNISPSYSLRTEHESLFEKMVADYTQTGVDRILNFSVFKKELGIKNYSGLSNEKAEEVKKLVMVVKSHADKKDVLISRLKAKDVQEALIMRHEHISTLNLILKITEDAIQVGETYNLHNVIDNLHHFDTLSFESKNLIIHDYIVKSENTVGDYVIRVIGRNADKEYTKNFNLRIEPIKEIAMKAVKNKLVLFTSEFGIELINIEPYFNQFISQANKLPLENFDLLANACLRVAVEEALSKFFSKHSLKVVRELSENIKTFKNFFTFKQGKNTLKNIATKNSYSYQKLESFVSTINEETLAKNLHHFTHNIQKRTLSDLKEVAVNASKLLLIISESL